MKKFTEFNSDLQKAANIAWEWNELEQKLANYRVRYGRGIFESLDNMIKQDAYEEYSKILKNLLEIKAEDTIEWDRLDKLGYSNSQIPSRYSIGNFIDTTHIFFDDSKK